MKPIYTHFAGALALTFGVAACVPAPRPAPPVQVRPTPAPAPTPVATPAPVYDSWMDAPQTPGDWRYSSPQAIFADPDPSGGLPPPGIPKFIMECRGDAIRLMARSQARGPGTMIVRSESATRSLATQPMVAADGAVSFAYTDVPASDRLLDAMALSKGRFAVEVTGAPTLYLPSWAEVTRVIEDCR